MSNENPTITKTSCASDGVLERIAKLEAKNAKLLELLTDARDDIADKVYLNSQMLPYKQGRYDASVKQLADIDALLAETERNLND